MTVTFEDPKTGEKMSGEVLLWGENNTPSQHNVTIVSTEDDVISVPNGNITSKSD